MTSAEQQPATFRPAALLGGSLSPRSGHLPFLADLITALKPTSIVEVGVAYGDTYFGICQYLSERKMDCSVYGVDQWNGHESETSPIFEAVSRYNEGRFKLFGHLIRASTHDAVPQFEDSSISILDIDGLRPYESLKTTYDAWLPKVKLGGVILLNGISVHGGDAGASRLWNEVKSSFPHFAFRNNQGLGVFVRSPRDSKQIGFLAELFNATTDEQERIRRHYKVCAERLEEASHVSAPPTSDQGYSLFQVFYSRDSKYETTQELSHQVASGAWVTMSLDLPLGVGDLPLRLNVSNKPAVVDIATLSLRKEDGHTVWIWNPKDTSDQLRVEGSATRMPEPEFFRVLALGNAPHVFLPLFSGSEFTQPLELEVRLRVDLELNAVRKMTQDWGDLEKHRAQGDLTNLASGAAAASVAIEAAVTKAKADSAKYLALARIDNESKIRQITADTDAKLEAITAELNGLRTQLDTARAEHETTLVNHMDQLAEERKNHQLTFLEKENLVNQQPRMLQEISIAQGNVEELKAEVERLSGELANLEFDNSELRKLNSRLSANLEEEREIRVNMQQSGSWQLTKPIRAVGDLFGPRKKY